VPKLREYIESMRAIWSTWQNGTPLRYEGEHYKFTLMTPFFAPNAMPYSDIPIYIAGVNDGLCRLAGELCQGFHVHAFHTPRYLRELIIPNIEAGAAKAGRKREDISLNCAIFVVTGKTDEEIRNNGIMVKSQIAFYASTPSYEAVLAMHGWQEVSQRLNTMSRAGRWAEMWQEISDEMLAEFAVVAPEADLARKVKERYTGLLDRVGYYVPFKPEDTQWLPLWQDAAKVFAS
jgi:probable F420-dependent oxidoreductase